MAENLRLESTHSDSEATPMVGGRSQSSFKAASSWRITWKFHVRRRPCAQAAASSVPSGEKANALTEPATGARSSPRVFRDQ